MSTVSIASTELDSATPAGLQSPHFGFASSKVLQRHLDRLAIVYVRQSDPQQVLQHRESKELQYNLVERAVALGGRVLARLQDIQERHPTIVTSVRGEGLMLSLDLSAADSDAKVSDRLTKAILFRCVGKGMILNYPSFGASLGLSFPLNVAEDDAEFATTVLGEALDELS